MEFEEAMMVRAAAQGNKEAQTWLDELDEREGTRAFVEEFVRHVGGTLVEHEHFYTVTWEKR
jgi:hypothetical protein